MVSPSTENRAGSGAAEAESSPPKLRLAEAGQHKPEPPEPQPEPEPEALSEEPLAEDDGTEEQAGSKPRIEAAPEHNKSDVTCPKGHALHAFVASKPSGPSSSWTAYCCDMCGGRIQNGATALGCSICNYDICVACEAVARLQGSADLPDLDDLPQLPDSAGGQLPSRAAAFVVFDVVLLGQTKQVRWPLWTRSENKVGWDSFANLVSRTHKLPALLFQLTKSCLSYVADDGEPRTIRNGANFRTLLEALAARDQERLAEPFRLTIELERKKPSKTIVPAVDRDLPLRQHQMREKLLQRRAAAPKAAQKSTAIQLNSWSRLDPKTHAWRTWEEAVRSLIDSAPELLTRAGVKHIAPPRSRQQGKNAYVLVPAAHGIYLHSFAAFGRRFAYAASPGDHDGMLRDVLRDVHLDMPSPGGCDMPRGGNIVVAQDVTILLAVQPNSVIAVRTLFEQGADAMKWGVENALVPDRPGGPSKWISICALPIEQFHKVPECTPEQQFHQLLLDKIESEEKKASKGQRVAKRGKSRGAKKKKKKKRPKPKKVETVEPPSEDSDSDTGRDSESDAEKPSEEELSMALISTLDSGDMDGAEWTTVSAKKSNAGAEDAAERQAPVPGENTPSRRRRPRGKGKKKKKQQAEEREEIDPAQHHSRALERAVEAERHRRSQERRRPAPPSEPGSVPTSPDASNENSGAEGGGSAQGLGGSVAGLAAPSGELPPGFSMDTALSQQAFDAGFSMDMGQQAFGAGASMGADRPDEPPPSLSMDMSQQAFASTGLPPSLPQGWAGWCGDVDDSYAFRGGIDSLLDESDQLQEIQRMQEWQTLEQQAQAEAEAEEEVVRSPAWHYIQRAKERAAAGAAAAAPANESPPSAAEWRL